MMCKLGRIINLNLKKLKLLIFILLISVSSELFSFEAENSNDLLYKNDSVLLDLTKEILTAIKDKDYKQLTEYIHPEDGIRFSPYGFIDTANDVTATRSTFRLNAYINKKRVWGYFDGSGDPIKMTSKEYFKRFVYDADFLNAEKTSLNVCLGSGNSQNNILAIYDNLPFTESYFSGFDEKFGGMDWRALRLVFKEYEGEYYLVAIVHDEWTI